MTNPNFYVWINLVNIYKDFQFYMLFHPWISDDNISDVELEKRRQAFTAVKIVRNLRIAKFAIFQCIPTIFSRQQMYFFQLTYKNFTSLLDFKDTSAEASKFRIVSIFTFCVVKCLVYKLQIKFGFRITWPT